MGMLNPRTNKHEAVTEVITADGQPPAKAKDVIFFKLESGDRVGVNEASEYLSAVKDIRRKKVEAIQHLEKASREEIVKAYEKYVGSPKGGKN